MNTTNPIDYPELFSQARAVALNAYSPYSNFKVGAAILLETGEIFAGCNVENGSYGITNCAERTALFSAVAALGPSVRIRAVAIVSTTAAPVYPCGACRNVINEFSDPSTPVAMETVLGSSDDLLISTIGVLVPYDLQS